MLEVSLPSEVLGLVGDDLPNRGEALRVGLIAREIQRANDIFPWNRRDWRVDFRIGAEWQDGLLPV